MSRSFIALPYYPTSKMKGDYEALQVVIHRNFIAG